MWEEGLRQKSQDMGTILVRVLQRSRTNRMWKWLASPKSEGGQKPGTHRESTECNCQTVDTDKCIVNKSSLLLELQTTWHYTDHSWKVHFLLLYYIRNKFEETGCWVFSDIPLWEMWGGTGLSWDWKPPSSGFCQLVGPWRGLRSWVPWESSECKREWNWPKIPLELRNSKSLQCSCWLHALKMHPR